LFGPGGISVWQLLIILVIVVLLFGTKKLRGMGGDLGSAIKSFRKSVKDEPPEEESESNEALANDNAQKTESAATGKEQEKS